MTDLGRTLRKLERRDPPELWAEIEGRAQSSAAEPPLQRRWVPALVALAVSALTFAFLVVTFVVPEETPVGGPLERERIDLGIDYFRTDVVAADGRVWILTTQPDFGFAVASVDSQTFDRQVFPLGVGDADGAMGSLAVGEGSVWVTFAPVQGGSYDEQPGVVFRLDESTGEILQRITVGRHPTGIVVSDGTVWVAEEAEGRITRIDASSGEPVGTKELGDGPRRIVAAFGWVWVETAFATTEVVRLDPSTGEATGSVEGVYNLSVGLDTLFVVEQGGEPNGAIRQIDPATAAFVGAPLGLDIQPAVVIAGDGQVWIGRWFQDETPPPEGMRDLSLGEFHFYRVDPSSLQPTGEEVDACTMPTGAVLTGGSLWFSCEGDLFIVHLSDTAPSTESEAPSPIEVPDVTGLPMDEGISRLEELGLVVEIAATTSGEAAEGLVMAQDPFAGTLVEPGSTTFLVVSEGLPQELRPVFFPTWSAPDYPLAIVSGVLVEHDGCLFLQSGLDSDVLLLWEEGYRYVEGAVLDPSGEPVVRLGDGIRGGGGYGSDWSHAEQITGQEIPGRCRPSGTEPYALIYDVERVA